MKFSNKRESFTFIRQSTGLIIGLGAIFLQIWILMTCLESYFSGVDTHLFSSMILSALCFFGCGVSLLLTKEPKEF